MIVTLGGIYTRNVALEGEEGGGWQETFLLNLPIKKLNYEGVAPPPQHFLGACKKLM